MIFTSSNKHIAQSEKAVLIQGLEEKYQVLFNSFSYHFCLNQNKGN